MTKRDEGECLYDIEIDYINKKRNIPFQLSPEEELLYGHSQDITLKQLEAIRDKFLSRSDSE